MIELVPTGSVAPMVCVRVYPKDTSLSLKACLPPPWPRHCVSGLSLSPGPQNGPDEELVSPESCYECKINSLPPRDRARRSVHRAYQVPQGMHWAWWHRRWWGQLEDGPRLGTPDCAPAVRVLCCRLGLPALPELPDSPQGSLGDTEPHHPTTLLVTSQVPPTQTLARL